MTSDGIGRNAISPILYRNAEFDALSLTFSVVSSTTVRPDNCAVLEPLSILQLIIALNIFENGGSDLSIGSIGRE